MSFPLNALPASFQEDHGTTELADEKPVLDDGGEDERLDLDSAREKVWLVKVPKFLMERWSAVPEEGVVLGRVRVYDEKDSNGDPKIEIHLAEPPPPAASTSDLKGKGRIAPLPTEYKLTLQNTATKNMFVFGEKEEDDEETGDVGHRKRRRVTSMLGTVHHECSLTPSISSLAGSKSYSTIMRARQQKATETTRKAKVLDVDAGTANRLASGMGLSGVRGRVSNFVRAKVPAGQKAESRAARMPRNELLDLLFARFEASQYWTIKALKEHVLQPEVYLKEVLGDVAQLIKRGPYSGMWSLRDEFKNGPSEGKAPTMKEEDEKEMHRRQRDNPLAEIAPVEEPEPDEEMEEMDEVA